MLRPSVFLAVLTLIPSLALARVETGLEVLAADHFKALEGRRVAIITNHTGVDINGRSVVDLLRKAPGVTVTAILSPEHGFRGDVADGVKIANTTDTASGLPIYGLYGETFRPTPAMLKNADTIVFDIQDIGTRFYTFITTMGMAMEEAARRRMKFVVLDRPNPVRGDIIEGDVLDADIRRMTGYFEIPVRHGLTVGELARWMNKTRRIGADLEVVKMKNWRRDLWYTDTGLPFLPPSPNIPTPATALVYAGIGCFEATAVSVGRGTTTPFQIFGAPWINGPALASYLREQNFKGVVFEPVTFVPAREAYQGQTCQGVRLIVTDRNEFRPFDVFITAFLYLYRQDPEKLRPEWEEIRVVTGSNRLREAASGGWRLDDLLEFYHDRSAEFSKTVAPFRLY